MDKVVEGAYHVTERWQRVVPAGSQVTDNGRTFAFEQEGTSQCDVLQFAGDSQKYLRFSLDPSVAIPIDTSFMYQILAAKGYTRIP